MLQIRSERTIRRPPGGRDRGASGKPSVGPCGTSSPASSRPQRGRLVHAAAVGPPVVRQSSVPAGPRAPLLGGARCFGTDRQPAAAEGRPRSSGDASRPRRSALAPPGGPAGPRRRRHLSVAAAVNWLAARRERARRWPPKTEIGTPKKTLKLEVRFGFGPPANASTSEPSRNQTAGAWRPPRATRPPLLTCLGRPRSRAAAGLEVSSTLLVA